MNINLLKNNIFLRSKAWYEFSLRIFKKTQFKTLLIWFTSFPKEKRLKKHEFIRSFISEGNNSFIVKMHTIRLYEWVYVFLTQKNDISALKSKKIILLVIFQAKN